jgi:23S rRNA (guanine745-N1)-methyltransferase
MVGGLLSRQASFAGATSMSVFSCLVCEKELIKEEERYVCENNHSFDISKEGYINLLPSNQKKSKNPGDDKQMIRSRREFLDLGYYDPISEALNEEIWKLMPRNDDKFRCLDLGCGEGFFLWKLRQVLNIKDTQANYDFYGIDISKPAIRYAAKRDKLSHFAIASIYKLPILDSTMDCVTRIFAPKSYAEFSRVLQPEGLLHMIVPESEHLMSLKRLIYEEAKRHVQADDPELNKFFTMLEQINIKYTISLEDSDSILKLINMTPYYWNMSKNASARIAELSELEVEIDCLLSIYEKRNDTR